MDVILNVEERVVTAPNNCVGCVYLAKEEKKTKEDEGGLQRHDGDGDAAGRRDGVCRLPPAALVRQEQAGGSSNWNATAASRWASHAGWRVSTSLWNGGREGRVDATGGWEAAIVSARRHGK